MATQRYISTSFWDDPWISSLDPSEKFIYMYLLTNPLTNIAGIYEITTKRICFDTGYNTETVKKVLKRFQDSNKAYRYKHFTILPSWPKHQKWEKSPKIKAGIDLLLSKLPKEVLQYTLSIGYQYPLNYSDLDLDLDLDLDPNIDIDKDIEVEKVKKKSSVFKPPLLEDIKAYISEKNYFVDAEYFYNYFTVGEWKDSKGNKVKNWKQKVITWHGHSKPKDRKSPSITPTKNLRDGLDEFQGRTM